MNTTKTPGLGVSLKSEELFLDSSSRLQSHPRGQLRSLFKELADRRFPLANRGNLPSEIRRFLICLPSGVEECADGLLSLDL